MTLSPARSHVLTFAAAAAALLHPVPGGGQGPTPDVQHFTVKDGLAQSWVSSVAQDSSGFMWLATKRGLQRFDGHAFVSYAVLDTGAPAELSGETGRLNLDRAGRLWVATPSALLTMDSPGRWQRFPLRERLTGWHEDSGGNVWYADVEDVRVIERAAGAPVVRSVYRTDQGGLLVSIVERAGLVWAFWADSSVTVAIRVNPRSGEIMRFRVPHVHSPSAAREDERGRVWIVGVGGGAVLAPADSVFRSVGALRGDTINDLVAADGGGQILLGRDAILRLDAGDRITGRWSPAGVFESTSLFQQLAVDREGGLWLPSLTRGVFRVDLRGPLFEHLARRTAPELMLASDFVVALHEDRRGTLWIATLGGGLTAVAPDGAARTFRHVPGDASSLASDEVWDIHEHRDGALWVGTNGGLCAVLPRGYFRCYRPPWGSGVIGGITEDDAGRLWIADYGTAVATFDTRRGTFGPPTRPLGGTAFVGLHLDRQTDLLWIGTQSDGPLRARVSAGVVTEKPRPMRERDGTNSGAYDFHRDARGTFWVASDRGLERWDPGRDTLERVSPPALEGTTVFSIEEDYDGHLWLGTSHGLVRYATDGGDSRRFGPREGLQSGEFNRGAALRRRSGQLVFGGVDGMTRFRPEDVVTRTLPPPLVFTRWSRLTSAGTVEAPVSGAETLVTGPRDGAFTIEFAALTFGARALRRYRYRLEGLDPDWIETSEPRVTYGAPRAGRYVFRVESAVGEIGEGAAPSIAIGIRVLPPVWGTLWFRALAVMLVGVALWALHLARLRSAVATERLRLRISRDLHDEVGSGLSSLALLSDTVAASTRLGDRERGQLARIGASARSMVAELRDIVWAIDPGNDRLDDVVDHMHDSAGILLQGMRVTFHAPSGSALATRLAMTARRELLLLYKELLHNASRHAGAREVAITIEVGRSELTLTVADDGEGFMPDEVRRGTGLRSVRERATRAGGRFELESAPGRGTTARVSLPLT
ncbi:MAG TPA: two-component regulator propeller domain-containing protein [Gemmatimonadaceae bacterium]|nr:two-component regulator propeller domain-containing protein [Gemmatimonadaceae bacterium]